MLAHSKYSSLSVSYSGLTSYLCRLTAYLAGLPYVSLAVRYFLDVRYSIKDVNVRESYEAQ